MRKKRQKTDSSNDQNGTGASEPIVLAEDLELNDAGAWLERMQGLTDKQCHVVLDGSQVRVIDTAMLQLLVAVFRQAKQQKTPITWRQPSDALRDTAALLGLEMHLDLATAGNE